MPNHVHVIIHIRDQSDGLGTVHRSNTKQRMDSMCRGTSQRAPVLNPTSGTQSGTSQRAPTILRHSPVESKTERFGKPTSNSLPTITRLIKSTITKQINLLRNSPSMPVWQRNYYEHIIRDEKSLYYIRKYIQENPAQWRNDMENHIDKEILDFEMSEIEDAKFL
jgi:putative transposase